MGAGKEHIIIQWTKPESDGGNEISNYLVDKREKKSLRWTRVNKDYVVYDTRLKVTGLMEGCDYQFRVTAVNAAGNSEPSEASNFICCREPSCECETQTVNPVPTKTGRQISSNVVSLGTSECMKNIYLV